MAHILMDKLPNIFLIYFHREGVIHEIRALKDGPRKTLDTPKKDIVSPPSVVPPPVPLSSQHVATPPGPSHTPTSTRK